MRQISCLWDDQFETPTSSPQLFELLKINSYKLLLLGPKSCSNALANIIFLKKGKLSDRDFLLNF